MINTQEEMQGINVRNKEKGMKKLQNYLVVQASPE